MRVATLGRVTISWLSQQVIIFFPPFSTLGISWELHSTYPGAGRNAHAHDEGQQPNTYALSLSMKHPHYWAGLLSFGEVTQLFPFRNKT